MIADVTANAVAPVARRARHNEGLSIQRVFTKPGVDPFSQIEWETRRSEIKSPDGKKVIFEMPDAEAPKSWSQTALDIAADKYFRKAGVPTPSGKETSVRQMVDRVAKALRKAGEGQGGYFATEADAQTFENELRFMLVNQYGAFNSPVWFNVGLAEAYGIKGKCSENFVWNSETSKVETAPDSYSRPAASACFIVSVEDDLLDIARHVEREMRIFRFGGGSGGNYSRLRAEGESLSNGGVSSGLMSFLKVFDVSAGAIKSGGTTRRAAKLVCLDADHPDIEKFIDWKVKEEEKALALINAGYPRDFNGEAYQTVSGQNANNSVRLTDEFMQAVLEDKPWQTKWRTTGKVAATLSAKKLFRKIADAAHRCADPGLMFDTTINRWNPVINTGRIEAANPCVTGDTMVSTSAGFKRIVDLLDSDFNVVGSDGELHAVKPAFCTGVKPVYRMRTRCGYEVKLTADHLVLTANRGDVKACELTKDDKIVLGAPTFGSDKIDSRIGEFVGLMAGDGCLVHEANVDRVVLTLSYDERDLASKIHDNLMSFKRENATDGREARAFEINERESTLCIQTAATCIVSETSKYAVLDKGSEGKAFTDAAFGLDKKSLAAVLRGLFTADGTVGNYGEKTQYISLDSVSLTLLQQTQQMLLQFGIKSKLYMNRRGHDFDVVMLPDGKGGAKEYPVQQSHSLRISRSSRFVFAREIGFASEKKSEKLSRMNASVAAYADVMHDTIVEFTPLGEERVYDLTEPNTHHFVANGVVVHNCNEFHFLQNTACNLSSLNVTKFMSKKDGAWHFDVQAFRHAARIFTIAKEIIVDYASYPTREIAQNSHDYRPLGLGYANLGAALMIQGIPYDSNDGCAFAAAVNSVLCGVGYETSAEIAMSKGPFPGFAHNREPMLNVIGMHRKAAHALQTERYAYIANEGRRAWDSAMSIAERHGVRNGQLTVTAPTGTIGFLMDCDTTGVEPDFSLVKHKGLAGGGYLKIVNRSVDAALETMGYSQQQRASAVKHVLEHGTLEGWSDMKPEHLPVFDCANKCGDGKRFIEPMGHIRMLAAVQPFVSGSISKTVNCPGDTTVEEIEAIYMEAWKRGLKCLAIYRDKSKHAQVLDSGDAKNGKAKVETKVEAGSKSDVNMTPPDDVVAAPRAAARDDRSSHGPPLTQRHRLPKKRPGGFTQEIKVGGQKLYIRTGEYNDGSIGELFIDMHKDGSTMRSMTNMFSIAVSLGLQHGVPLKEFVDAFTFMKFDPAGPVDHPHVKMSTSVVDAVFRLLALEYMGDDGLEFVQNQPTEEELAEMRGRRALLLAANDARAALAKARPAKTSPTPTNGNGVHAKSNTGAFKRSMAEAQTCGRCGNLTVRTGTCSTCTACGLSTGCA